MVNDAQTTCRIVFWNVNRKALSGHIAEMAVATSADVVVLAEYGESAVTTRDRLACDVDSSFFIPSSISDQRFHCFCRVPDLDLTEVHCGMRMSVRRMRLGAGEVLLALVHGVDIRNYDPETRQSFVQSLADEIRFVKSQQQNRRVIVLGDFNMNPFDRGMNLATGMNAMMTRSCAAPGKRTFLGQQYDLYYNPMWNLFGDQTPGPAGTCYDTSSQGPFGWSMLDQVIFDSTAVDIFRSVEILANAGSHTLTDARGRPDSVNASDHLPILVELNHSR